jgi:ubiquinone/menaquinone biosynthesis C-methylase UbiE
VFKGESGAGIGTGMSAFLPKIFSAVRGAMMRKNERGLPTADHLRLKVRKTTRKLIRSRKGYLIDIGCGEGYLLEGMLGEGELRAVLFDNEIKMLAQVKEAYSSLLHTKAFPVLGEAQSLPFKNSVIDIAVCLNTFYNLPSKAEVSRAIMQIFRILKPGGKFIFDVRNRTNPLVKWAYQQVRKYDPSIKDLPLNAYTYAEIEAILENAGLKMDKCHQLYFPSKYLSPIFILETIKI